MNIKVFIYILMGMTTLSLYAQNTDGKQNEREPDKLLKSEQRFRIGEIIDAGISLKKVKIKNTSKLLPLKIKRPVYAIVRVQLDPGRSISTHDFSMIHNYQLFRCIAIRPYNGSFNAERRIFPPSKQSKIYDLLFVLNIPSFKSTIKYKCTLHYNLSTSGLTDVDVKFKNFDRNTILFKSIK